MIILQHPDPRGNLRGLKIRDTFWERNEAPLPPLRPRCNFIHPRQLSPFHERLELPFTSDEILSGYEEINCVLRNRSLYCRSWYDIWLVFKKSYRRLSRGIGHLLRQTVPTNIFLLDHLCRSGSAPTTGIQVLDVERKMPLRSRSQASGVSSRYKKQLSMSIMTSLQIGST